MSSMSSIYRGVSGLTISQQSLNVAAHNLANTDTLGYVRQQVLTTDFVYRNLSNGTGNLAQVGLGTDMAIVRQVRDEFLDKSYRTESGRQGFYDAQYSTVREVEDLFGELEGIQFQNSMENFWSTLQEMSKTPDDIAARETFINTAVSFIERAEKISKQLNQYQININTEISDKVDRINDIASRIAYLNKEISFVENAGVEQANDYRDERNNLLDELGQLVNISYDELSTGVVVVSAEGMQFIEEDVRYKMGLEKIRDDSNMLKPVWEGVGMDVFRFDKECNTSNNTNVGYLKGLVLSRGDSSANYTDIPVRADYDSDAAFEKATMEYNKNIDQSVIKTVQAQFDQLIHGIVTTVNDILCPNKEITLDNGKKITVLDEENAPLGMDSDKTMGQALFNRKSMDRYEKVTVQIGGQDVEVYKYNEEDADNKYSLFTLGEIEVNPEILKDRSVLPLSSNDGTGYDRNVCDKLIDAWNTPFASISPNVLYTNNFKDYYTSFMGALANRGNVLNSVATDQAGMVMEIDNRRQMVAGVSSDEELTNIIKYQHAYNAASRYINVVSEMLEHIVTRLG